ncbi:hypothetical protein BKA93DRAFT_470714 [Sparassis latifolia]
MPGGCSSLHTIIPRGTTPRIYHTPPPSTPHNTLSIPRQPLLIRPPQAICTPTPVVSQAHCPRKRSHRNAPIVPELTLRDLPFSNTHPTSALGRQGHPGYGAATVPPQPYRPCSHPTSSSAQYGSSMSSLQSLAEGHQYYSTPAHTMQMYPPHGSHTPGPHASIVIPPSTPEAPTVERYQCDKCDKTFGRSHDRKRHFETQHMQPHPHLCPQCKKSFSRGDSLKRHIDNGGCEKAPY